MEFEPNRLPKGTRFVPGALALEGENYVPAIICFKEDQFLLSLARASSPLSALEAAEEADEDLADASSGSSFKSAAIGKKLVKLGYRVMKGAGQDHVKRLEDLLSPDERSKR